MTNYKDQWQTLQNQKDAKNAVYEHLSSLFSLKSVNSELQKLLKDVCQKATSVEVQEEKLIIDFEGGFQLKCSAPASYVADVVPKSYAQIAKVHNYIELELPDDVPVSYYGVGEKGKLSGSELMIEAEYSDFYEELEDAGFDSDNVFNALMYSQNELVFSPLENNQFGEPSLYFIDHADCEPEPFAGSNMPCSEVFLIILAEKILEQELMEQFVDKVPEVQIGSFSFPADSRELTLRGENLEDFGQEIGQLKKLSTLNLINCTISSFPKELFQLSRLKKLKFQNNGLKSLPEEIGNLVSLEKIDIRENDLEELPESIGKLKKLEEIWIKNSELRALPEEFCALGSLKRISLIENKKLKGLPENMGNLSDVTSLLLNNCESLEYLPEGIGGMTRLEEFGALRTSVNTVSFRHLCGALQLKKIDITEAQITHVPKEIGNLKNLEKLNLENNPVEWIAPEIGQLSQLWFLGLDGGVFTEIPDELGNLAALNHLSLGGKEIKNLPQTMEGLSEATFIKVAGCTLGQVPDWLLGLPSLSTLCIKNWFMLETIGDAIGSGKIRRLWLFDCPRLKYISPRISSLEELKDIAIRNSSISKDTTDTLCQIATLQELEISGSALKSIPLPVTRHESLLKLHLRDNQITEITPEIKNMKKLWYLDLEGNRIENLSENILKITGLHTLDLSGNPVTGFPETFSKASDLSKLILRNCKKLSSEDISQIQKSLPDCNVVYES